MPSSTGSDRTVVYAHNPHRIVTKTTKPAGQARPNGRKPAAKKRAPARRTPTRRNPSFGSRAGQLYKQAGGLIIGGIAAEQAGRVLQDVMPDTTSPTVAALVPAAATGVLGVFLAGMRGDLASNVGLGMVVTSAANVVAFGASKLGIGEPSLSTASDSAKKARGTGRALRETRMSYALPAHQDADAGCGCSRSVAGYGGGYGGGYGAPAERDYARLGV